MTIDMDEASREAWNDAYEGAFYDTRHYETKHEIVSYYKQEHGKQWKIKLTGDLADFTGMKRKSLEKRFDPQRLDSPEKRNAKQYEEFGKTLPPYKEPKAGKRLKVTVTVWIVISKGPPIKKEFTRILTEVRTRQVLKSAETNAIWEEYGINPDDIIDMEDMTIDMELI